MKEIKLSNRDFTVLVDDDDFDWLSRFSWYAKDSRHGEYPCTNVRVGKRVLTFRLHRLVMYCFSDLTVDHLNRDRRNCQKKNLEVVTNEVNARRQHETVPF